MDEISKSIVKDLLRNWTLWIYVSLLFLGSFGLFSLVGDGEKAALGVLNIVLLVIPAFSLIFSVIYYFNASDFVLVLLAQPLARKAIIISFMLSLSVVFVLIILLGCGMPLFIFAPGLTSLSVLVSAIFLSIIFVGFGLLIGVNSREKSRGLGAAMILWFYFALVFDGLMLMLLYAFNDYPIEKIAIYLTFLNPIDLARIMTLLHTDAAALMGYTGAVFERFFNAQSGTLIAIVVLLSWIFIPGYLTIRKFERKSF